MAEEMEIVTSQSDPERVKSVLQRYEQARSAKAAIMEKFIELDKFDRGDQWQGEVPPWVPKPVTNYIHLVKTTQRANLALQNQVAILRPNNPLDVDAVAQLQKVLDCVWDKTGSRYVVRDCIETALLLGTAIAMVYWDATEVSTRPGMSYVGDVKVKMIDPANFFPDPNAYRLQDCQYVDVTELVPLSWVQNDPLFLQYAGPALLEIRSNTNRASDSEIYNRPYVPDSMNGDLVLMHNFFEKVRLPNGQYRIDVTYVVGDVEVYRIEGIEPNIYPFAVLYDYPQRKSFWAKSTCELILENQKIVNKVEQVMAIIATLLQNPQKEVVKESGINPKDVALKGNKAGMVWTSNIPNGIRNIEPPKVPDYLIQFAEYSKQNIREQTGMNEAYTGESVGSLTTSTGVNALIERATVRDRDKMVEIEIFIKDLVSILLQYVLSYYKEDRWLRIVGEDGTVEFFEFQARNFQDVMYDIHVDVSASMPTTKALLQNQARDLLNMQGQYGFDPAVIEPEEALDMMDIRNKEQIKARMREQRINNQAEDAVKVASMLAPAMIDGVPAEMLHQMALQMLADLEQQRKQQPPGSRGGAGNTAQPSNLPPADGLAMNNMLSGR